MALTFQLARNIPDRLRGLAAAVISLATLQPKIYHSRSEACAYIPHFGGIVAALPDMIRHASPVVHDFPLLVGVPARRQGRRECAAFKGDVGYLRGT